MIAGEAYSVSGMLLIPSGQATAGHTALSVHWRGDLACTVSLGLGPVSTADLEGVFDTWTYREKRGISAPAGAVAARVYVVNTKHVAGGMFSSLADDVSFTVDPFFADGFETNNVDAWSTSTP